ncbi:MAG: hypothetical protein JWO91_1712 [Acidobacteriaceae bacterium]|jgi:hypothetical protein|nr:hypothetical protein [Acidobacteriaceae bacterium]
MPFWPAPSDFALIVEEPDDRGSIRNCLGRNFDWMKAGSRVYDQVDTQHRVNQTKLKIFGQVERPR